MFCKKCGKEIKNGVSFCPKCGAAAAPSVSVPQTGHKSAGTLSMGTVSAPVSNAPGQPRNIIKYAVILGSVLIFAAIIAVVVFLAARDKEEKLPEEEYSVTGTWSSDDAEDLGSILEEILYDNLLESMGSSAAGSVSGGVRELLDGFSGVLETVFRDNGKVELYVDNISVEVFSLSYEVIDESEMKLTMKFPSLFIPYLGSIEIPSVSYKAEYYVAETWMSLDFFGYELEFTRKK